MYFVYILYSTAYNRFYIGQTDDLSARLTRHNNGYEKATSPYKPWELIFKIEKATRSEAMALEKKLKNLNPKRLKAFILKYSKDVGRDEA